MTTRRRLAALAPALLALLALLAGAGRLRAASCAAPDDTLWIDVNLPAFRLDVYAGWALVARHPVAPGQPDYRTPRGRFAISAIEWNPWWIPPDSRWARRERVTPPGPSNPMGRVKLHFLPLYFFHGTPYEGSIGTAASHGCVRLRNEDAVALALLVLQQQGSAFDADSVRAVLDGTTTRRLQLAAQVPVQIRYEVVEVLGDSVAAYRDVYGLGAATGERVRAALVQAGRDTAALDDARVAAFVRQGRRRGAVVPIDSLRASPSREADRPSAPARPRDG